MPTSTLKLVPASAPVHPRKRQPPHIILTAQNLAKAARSPRERALLAALWIRGGLTIAEPTVMLAARVFDVGPSTLHDAIDNLADTAITSAQDASWAAMTPTERADFCLTHLTEVWTALEMATAA